MTSASYLSKLCVDERIVHDCDSMRFQWFLVRNTRYILLRNGWFALSVPTVS